MFSKELGVDKCISLKVLGTAFMINLFLTGGHIFGRGWGKKAKDKSHLLIERKSM